MKNIGFFTTNFALNKKALLKNLSIMLSKRYKLHLFTPCQYSEQFQIQNVVVHGFSFSKILQIRKLCRKNKVKTLMNLTGCPVDGCMVLLLCQGIETNPILRISGEHWKKYMFVEGFKKKLSFLLSNIVSFPILFFPKTGITLGPNLKKMGIKHGFKSNQLTILPQPVNISIFHHIPKQYARNKLGIKEQTKIILFVGRMEPQKGISVLSKAVPKMINEDFFFFLIGPLRQNEYIDKISYSEHVRFTGSISQEKLKLFYNAADLLIHPSLTDGIPTVILEAMACGLPVIASDVGDISSISPPVILLNSLNPNALIIKIQKLFEMDERSLQVLEKQCIKKINDEYSIQALKNKYLTFFDSLCIN